jgi:hypothetical protein
MTDWVEVVAGERLHRHQRAALLFRTLGWISICWAAMVSIWIWMGYKSGANLWLWCTIAFFVTGVICLGIASGLQRRAARSLELPEGHRKDDDSVRAA